MERLPRIIFYFNLYLFKSLEEKERIAFTSKEKGYGFEEADGIFYLESKDVVLNKSGNISFFKKMSFEFGKRIGIIIVDILKKMNLMRIQK